MKEDGSNTLDKAETDTDEEWMALKHETHVHDPATCDHEECHRDD